MLSLVRHTGPHEESVEYWCSYIDHSEFFVLANKIKTESLVSFLGVMGGKTHNLLQSLE